MFNKTNKNDYISINWYEDYPEGKYPHKEIIRKKDILKVYIDSLCRKTLYIDTRLPNNKIHTIEIHCDEVAIGKIHYDLEGFLEANTIIFK